MLTFPLFFYLSFSGNILSNNGLTCLAPPDNVQIPDSNVLSPNATSYKLVNYRPLHSTENGVH